jgi:plasmid stabilization system protein ParE
MTPVIFLDPAEEEMIAAALYYEDQTVGLGEHFVAEVQHAVQRIAEHPTANRIIKREVRRRLLRRFPFGILYRIEKDEIIIAAVMHLRRRPGYWSERI